MNITNARKHVLKHMMPDTIQLLPSQAQLEVDAGGIPIAAAITPRTYMGSPNIPARFDASRAFRPEFLPSQAVTATEYQCNIPNDCDCDDSDTLLYNGREFKIRKLHNAGANQMTKLLVIEEVGHD